MKVASIVGARPQFVKLAPLCRAFARVSASASQKIDHVIIHTGQHYDPSMSAALFDELRIPPPSFDLGIGSGGHGRQTGRMLEQLELTLQRTDPSVVVVFGDTNSTLAGALAAAKLHQPTVHVEAGLRSFNRQMPEEVNRIVSDHVCDRLFAPTRTAMDNLVAENLSDRAVFTGDIMYDAVLQHGELAEAGARIQGILGLSPGRFGVVTIHRAQNTEGEELRLVLDVLNEVASSALPLVFPVHPRTRSLLQTALADWRPATGLTLCDPVGHLDMLWLLRHGRLVLTDSGGVQKEAFFLNCPCITLRQETEWPETLVDGGNVLVGTDRDAVADAVGASLARFDAGAADFAPSAREAFGDGNAAERMVAGILEASGEILSKRVVA